jgi:hypothetical protein
LSTIKAIGDFFALFHGGDGFRETVFGFVNSDREPGKTLPVDG